MDAVYLEGMEATRENGFGGEMGFVKVQKASLSWFTIIWVSIVEALIVDRRLRVDPGRQISEAVDNHV